MFHTNLLGPSIERHIVIMYNKSLDELQSQDNEKKEKELHENIPLTINLNAKNDDSAHVTQGKRPSPRPQRSKT